MVVSYVIPFCTCAVLYLAELWQVQKKYNQGIRSHQVSMIPKIMEEAYIQVGGHGKGFHLCLTVDADEVCMNTQAKNRGGGRQ